MAFQSCASGTKSSRAERLNSGISFSGSLCSPQGRGSESSRKRDLTKASSARRYSGEASSRRPVSRSSADARCASGHSTSTSFLKQSVIHRGLSGGSRRSAVSSGEVENLRLLRVAPLDGEVQPEQAAARKRGIAQSQGTGRSRPPRLAARASAAVRAGPSPCPTAGRRGDGNADPGTRWPPGRAGALAVSGSAARSPGA